MSEQMWTREDALREQLANAEAELKRTKLALLALGVDHKKLQETHEHLGEIVWAYLDTRHAVLSLDFEDDTHPLARIEAAFDELLEERDCLTNQIAKLVGYEPPDDQGMAKELAA